VRGVNAFPAQIAAVINAIDALSANIGSCWRAGPYDILPVEAELAERLAAAHRPDSPSGGSGDQARHRRERARRAGAFGTLRGRQARRGE